MIGESKIQKTILWCITCILGLLIIFPIWYMLVMGITPDGLILSNNVRIIPTTVYIQNIINVIKTTPVLKFMFNTVIVAVSILVLQIVTCLLAAFAFAFMEFKGKKVLFILAISTMMVPHEATIIANYLTISSWHWVDTYQALIIPFMTSSMGIFLIRQYFLTLAKEIHEAAMIDGCSNLEFLFRIALPLSRPILGAFGICSFLSSWNMYMWPLLVTNSDAMRTVQVGITALKDDDAAQSIGLAMAGVALVTIPSIIVFTLGHKQVVTGITAGAVKG